MIFKPIRLNEIKEFSNQCDILVQDLIQKRQEERILKLTSSADKFECALPKSKIYVELKEREKQAKEEEELKIQEKDKRMKLKAFYQKYVKDSFQPKVDSTK